MSTTTSTTTTATIASSSSTNNNMAYNQWQQWAQNQRKTLRREALENLIDGNDCCDRNVHQFMELPHKRRVSLLVEGSDDCDQQHHHVDPLLTMLKSRYSSPKDDDDDCDETDKVKEPTTQMEPSGNSADIRFLPPTCLRRSDDRRTSHLLAMRSLNCNTSSNDNTIKMESHLVSPSSRRSSLVTTKSFSVDSSSAMSAPPLPFLSGIDSVTPAITIFP
jgi:hypothetical protein